MYLIKIYALKLHRNYAEECRMRAIKFFNTRNLLTYRLNFDIM